MTRWIFNGFIVLILVFLSIGCSAGADVTEEDINLIYDFTRTVVNENEEYIEEDESLTPEQKEIKKTRNQEALDFLEALKEGSEDSTESEEGDE